MSIAKKGISQAKGNRGNHRESQNVVLAEATDSYTDSYLMRPSLMRSLFNIVVYVLRYFPRHAYEAKFVKPLAEFRMARILWNAAEVMTNFRK